MFVDGRYPIASTFVNVSVDVFWARRDRWENGRMARDLIEVLSTSSILEGEIVKARLEDEGIPVLLKGGGADPYGVGSAHVFVPADYEVQARLVLEGVDDRTEEPEGS
jgi:Putative prokaryotic signal transducing protein